MNASQKAYVQKVLPLASKVASKTGLAPELVAAWWTWETDWGKNQTSKVNNHAGIGAMSSGRDGVFAGHASYNSPDSFVNDYVRVISFQDPSYGYKAVLDAARQDPKNYARITQLHNSSKWSVANYNVSTIVSRAADIGGLIGVTGNTSVPDQKKTVKLHCPHCSSELVLSES